MEYIRDYAMYTAIFGFFSFSWFGWAQENPKKSWRLYIGIASGVALLISLVGIYLSVTHWNSATALSDPGVFRNYLIFVVIEFLLAGIGAAGLLKTKRQDYVAPWIAFIVGIHFIWLKDIFQDASLYILAILLIGVSVGSLFIAKKLHVANSAITGIGSGIVLFGFAMYGLIRFLLA
ncbi:hypothetical protein [Sutcliffiella rhizosphaerae]|uniref:Uncharacterized protein n=1 Tax=Sutcliffiella rhizosphaerae TaxID=2880967 RepID=A0ABM8YSZ1_9BACI|nr:hypothetical protein [Sutcliffiella rhizosphaerae]CAG9623085.1 hypothetical protein BACCIP111883_03881 [Sutcliffiella rhizosphaerae]